MTHPRITFIGAGNMATSLIGGLLAQGIPASHIRASDPGAEQRAKVAAEFGIELFESNAEAIAGADVGDGAVRVTASQRRMAGPYSPHSSLSCGRPIRPAPRTIASVSVVPSWPLS